MNKAFDIIAFNKGDEAAFKAAFDAYYRKVKYFLLRYARCEQDAEWAASEAFTHVYKFTKSKSTFETASHLLTTLKTISKRCLFNQYRPFKGARILPVEEMLYYDTCVDNTAIEGEVLEALYTCSSLLPETCRKIFRLYLQGFEPKEIASNLNLDIQTIRNQKTIAISLLRKRIPIEYFKQLT